MGSSRRLKPPGFTLDQQISLWVGATRYYLGRMSISVSSFCQLLREQWHCLPAQVHGILIRDIEEAFAQDDKDRARATDGRIEGRIHYSLGMDMDRACWEQVRQLWKGESL